MTVSLAGIDAVVARACGATVAVILLLGAIDKLRDQAIFEAIVDNYRLLPAALVGPVARLLPLAEIAAAVLLLAPLSRMIGAAAAVCLLLLFSVAIAANLIRGRNDLDCGCGGASGIRTLSWWLVVRNALLAAMAIVGAGAGAARDLTWLDGFTATSSTLALLALYVSFNQLGANSPRLKSLRRHA